ncbi:hypothetical protein A2U01_0010006 [Trifolium medium]|uniref:Uncharacterized protein n=1 Tax=Trifolium medium TaxID=97028 RepID=A0A392MPF7_9FABA|nr:hypothetical protein [Trifolium medium]
MNEESYFSHPRDTQSPPGNPIIPLSLCVGRALKNEELLKTPIATYAASNGRWLLAMGAASEVGSRTTPPIQSKMLATCQAVIGCEKGKEY